jgi:DNA polymerase III epsilon subunit-like protein
VRVLVLDTETTGFDPQGDRWIEVGMIEAVGGVDVGCFSSLIASPRSVPCFVRGLTGLDDQALREAPDEREVIAQVARSIERVDAVVCWNAAFDRSFVVAAFDRCGIALPAVPWRCALELARQQRPELPSHRLVDVAVSLGIDAGRSHRALDDAKATLAVWRALQPKQTTTTTTTTEPAPTGALALFR